MPVLTLTLNPTIDMTASAEKVVPEAKLRCGNENYDPGGGGINVARAIHKLGGKATAMFTAGGSDGKLLVDFLEHEKVATAAIPIENMTRRNITISEKGSGHQFRFVFPGPEISSKEAGSILEAVAAKSKENDFLILSGSLPPGLDDNFYADIIDGVSNRNCRIIVDTSGKPLQKILNKNIFMIKPNLRELRDLTGEDFNNEAHLKETAESVLHKSRIENIVVSLGRGGALLVSKDITKHFRAPIVPVKSKVGAGDSMVAGIVQASIEGMPMQDAVMFGLAAGAAAAMTPGIELCRNDDTRSIFTGLKESEENDFLAE